MQEDCSCSSSSDVHYSIVDSMFAKLMDVMADRGEVMEALVVHRSNAKKAFINNALHKGRLDNHPMFQKIEMEEIMEMIIAQKDELERMILEHKGEADTANLIFEIMDSLSKAVSDRHDVLEILMFGGKL